MPKSNPELAIAMGNRMAARRKELNLTQETVAELAGIAHQQYNKAENGKTCLGSDSLLRISRALRTSADYILSGEPNTCVSEAITIMEQMSEAKLKFVLEWLKTVDSYNILSKDET